MDQGKAVDLMNLREIVEKLSTVSDLYAKRFSIERSADWHLLKIQEELGELSAAYLKMSGRARTQGSTGTELKRNLEDEVADVLAMTLLFAKNQGIDPEQAIRQKWFRHLETTEAKVES